MGAKEMSEKLFCPIIKDVCKGKVCMFYYTERCFSNSRPRKKVNAPKCALGNWQ